MLQNRNITRLPGEAAGRGWLGGLAQRGTGRNTPRRALGLIGLWRENATEDGELAPVGEGLGIFSRKIAEGSGSPLERVASNQFICWSC